MYILYILPVGGGVVTGVGRGRGCVCSFSILFWFRQSAHASLHQPYFTAHDLWQGNVGRRNRKRGGSKPSEGGGESYEIIRTHALTSAIIHEINGKELREVKGQVDFYCNKHFSL